MLLDKGFNSCCLLTNLETLVIRVAPNDILVIVLDVLNLKYTRYLVNSTIMKYKLRNLQNVIQIRYYS